MELRASKGTTGPLLVVGIVFLAVGLGMAFLSPADHVTGWFVAAVGVGTTAMPLREVLRSGPLLVISDKGLDHRGSGVGAIAWSEISGVELVRTRVGSVMVIKLHDPQVWRERQPSWVQSLGALKRELGVPEVKVNISGLTRPADEVIGEVRRHLFQRPAV